MKDSILVRRHVYFEIGPRQTHAEDATLRLNMKWWRAVRKLIQSPRVWLGDKWMYKHARPFWAVLVVKLVIILVHEQWISNIWRVWVLSKILFQLPRFGHCMSLYAPYWIVQQWDPAVLLWSCNIRIIDSTKMGPECIWDRTKMSSQQRHRSHYLLSFELSNLDPPKYRKRSIGCFTVFMMTSSNGNISRVTGHLCGEFTGHRWIPRTEASDADLWCFLWIAPEQSAE